jgi:hypothetical protein
MKLSSLFENVIPDEDVKDAVQVFKDWAFQNRLSFGFASPERIFEKAFASGKKETLDIDKIKTHYDWGRRPESDNLPIVMRIKNGNLIVLDGQHRIFAAKDKKKTTIDCFVIEMPIRFSKPTKKYLLDESS